MVNLQGRVFTAPKDNGVPSWQVPIPKAWALGSWGEMSVVRMDPCPNVWGGGTALTLHFASLISFLHMRACPGFLQ